MLQGSREAVQRRQNLQNRYVRGAVNRVGGSPVRRQKEKEPGINRVPLILELVGGFEPPAC